ncbi:hypothetical protein E4T38_09962 [Aureobasidium subglaciale]|nr:hypothetical protein E4T38_09962 [Aureobasidium subglaciale]KAI5251743.1 hypothetical protein E4T46_09967 [Aureobasidium subglaciale]
MAIRVLRLNGDDKPLGKRWITKFIRDNPRIASVIGRPIEAARINGTHPDLIQEFYTAYEDAVRLLNIEPSNTYNIDEHGIALDREWVSIVETVSLIGGFTRPLIIFKGCNL